MNDEQYLLANAYLDGELTAEERRIAEADPEVMTEVEQLRALQAELRDVPMPTAAAREAAIRAAMTEFAGAVADEPAGTPVVPFRPRPVYAKFLAVAAAFVAVAGLGIILAQAGQGGDDDSSDSATAVLEDDAAGGDGEATASEASAAADSDVMMAADDAAEAAEESEAGVEDFAAEPVAEATAEATDEATAERADEDTAAESTGDTTETAGTKIRQVPADFDPEAPIADDVELGVYGAYLIAERDAGSLPPTPNHACVDTEHVLDEATLVLDDELVPVYVDVREADRLVAALHRDTCAELMLGTPYAD